MTARTQSALAAALPFCIGFGMGFTTSLATFASRISVVETKIDAIQQSLTRQSITQQGAPLPRPTSHRPDVPVYLLRRRPAYG